MLRRFSVNFAIFSMAFDAALVMFSLVVATYVRPFLSTLPFAADFPLYTPLPMLLYPTFALAWVSILLLLSVYDGRRNVHIIDEFTSLTLGSILAAVALLFLVHLLLSGFLTGKDHQSIQAEQQRIAREYARGGIDSVSKEIDARKRRFFIRLAGAQGNTIVTSDPEDLEDYDFKQIEARTPASNGWIILEEVEDDPFELVADADVLEILTLVLPDGNKLQVGKTSEERNDFQGAVLIVAGILAVPLLLVIATFLSNRALHPLRSMITTVETIQSGNLSARVPVTGSGDELDELAGLFNSMLQRIESLILAMQDSLDNVAHDLRTPVTRLRSSVEAALQSNGSADDFRAVLGDCMEETEEILSMLEALMDISEAQTGAMQLHREAVSVDKLIGDTVDLYRYVAEDRGLLIEGLCAEPLTVNVDLRRTRQALANLVDNAVKYTDSGGKILLNGRREGERVAISVSDTGPGIAAEELPRIWERLYRSDRARVKKGIGLGLSLVLAIVQSHGGVIEAKSEVGKGSEFTIFLPMSKSEGAIPLQ